MSLQERTLVVRNFDPERTTDKLLKELCIQGGPVRKVILRSDHAFVEFDDVESVGYTKAILEGVKMFDRILFFEPKIRLKGYSKYTNAMNDYIVYDRHQREAQRVRQQMEEQQRQMQLHYQNQFPVQPGGHWVQSQMQSMYPPMQVPQMQYYQQHQAPQYRPPQQSNFDGPQFKRHRR